jgi:pSer/pThr/pTyr-binding forkhead associated (FHA) protein
MEQNIQAFLQIEQLIKGKIEGYELRGEIPLSTDAVLIARPSRQPGQVQPDIKIVGDDSITRTHNDTRSHAEIYYSFSDGCFMLRDNGSTNGTFLNGEQLEIDKPYPLKDYDQIGLARITGEMRVIFRFRTSEATVGPWADDDFVKPKEGLSLNIKARRVYISTKEIPITKTEFEVIQFLYENKGNACSKDDIAWAVWGKEGASDETIAQYISRLRKKIELDPAKPRYIVTVHDRYRLDL